MAGFDDQSKLRAYPAFRSFHPCAIRVIRGSIPSRRILRTAGEASYPSSSMKRDLAALFLAVSFAALRSIAGAEADRFAYPQPPKSDQIDDYFGTKVPDPYRDLENADSAPTRKWIEAENKLTFDYLAGIPERKRDQRETDGALELREVHACRFERAAAISFPRTRACKTRACFTPGRACRARRSHCSIRIPSRKMAPSLSAESRSRMTASCSLTDWRSPARIGRNGKSATSKPARISPMTSNG